MEEKSIYKFKNKFYASGNLVIILFVISFVLFAYYDDFRFFLINLFSIFLIYLDKYSYSEIEFFEDKIRIKRSKQTDIQYSNISEIKQGKHHIILIEKDNYNCNIEQIKYRKSITTTTQTTHSYNKYIILPNTNKIYDLISDFVKLDVPNNKEVDASDVVISHQNKIKHLDILTLACLVSAGIFVILYIFIGYCSKELLSKYNTDYSLMLCIYLIITLLMYISLYRSDKKASLTVYNFHNTYIEITNNNDINYVEYSNIYELIISSTISRRNSYCSTTIYYFNSLTNKIEQLIMENVDDYKLIKITDLLQNYKTHSI